LGPCLGRPHHAYPQFMILIFTNSAIVLRDALLKLRKLYRRKLLWSLCSLDSTQTESFG
jgi:hypothetical protein